MTPSTLFLPLLAQLGFPGQSGIWQPSPVQPFVQVHLCVALLHLPWPEQSVPFPGHPGFSQYVPRHPTSHWQMSVTILPCSEHSLSQPTPTHPGSQTQVPLFIGTCWPFVQGSLQAGPIHPFVQFWHLGGSNEELHMPRRKQLGVPGQSGISQPIPAQPSLQVQTWVTALQTPWPVQSEPSPGQPGLSQRSPRHPRSHTHLLFTTLPCSEHSLSHPTPIGNQKSIYKIDIT